jgi:hypothetical protein
MDWVPGLKYTATGGSFSMTEDQPHPFHPMHNRLITIISGFMRLSFSGLQGTGTWE